MKRAYTLSKIDSFVRPYFVRLSPNFVTGIYSSGRKFFLKELTNHKPNKKNNENNKHIVKLWNLNFGNSLFNAAGMFKNGEGYDLAASLGAGAYLCGTTTSKIRSGNKKHNIKNPFAPFPRSNSAINWLGLPNFGHSAVAKKIQSIGHKKNCPLGASLAVDPDFDFNNAIAGLVEGLKLYDNAGICFMEINESCPNVKHNDKCEFDSTGLEINMINRLESISELYLKKRERLLPVIVKFSNDTNINQIPALIDLLIDLGFDGINLGNTSINYEFHSTFIHKKERKLFEYFINNFGGGLSGNLLKETSLELCKNAVNHLKTKNLREEFHVIRTGGVETKKDIDESNAIGVSLNQWFTGFFESYSRYGDNLYYKIYQ